MASGEELPERQGELQRYGHAMEVRLYAEDPARGFLPATGRIAHLTWPNAANNLRIDSGVRADDVISTHYDPMIAKVIAWGEDRATAAEPPAAAAQASAAHPADHAGKPGAAALLQRGAGILRFAQDGHHR